jgi:nitrate reductase (NAD(P)H)
LEHSLVLSFSSGRFTVSVVAAATLTTLSSYSSDTDTSSYYSFSRSPSPSPESPKSSSESLPPTDIDKENDNDHDREKLNVDFTFTAVFPTVPDPGIPNNVAEPDLNTPDRWVKRDSDMVRLTGKHPFNAEARLDTLFAAGFLTPISLFYVRNHGAVPKIPAFSPSPSSSTENASTPPMQLHAHSTWQVRVHGLVQYERSFTVDDLKRLFKVVTLPITLVCAGNRRKEQNVVAKSLGFNWGAAGLSTALFTGVYLADVLKFVRPLNHLLTAHIGNKGNDVAGLGHVIFEGADDDLPNGPYGTSQTLKWARNKDKGMLLAWKMNGHDLEPDHGFPIRLVVPGQIGGRSVKWLRRIEISTHESQHHVSLAQI